MTSFFLESVDVANGHGNYFMNDFHKALCDWDGNEDSIPESTVRCTPFYKPLLISKIMNHDHIYKFSPIKFVQIERQI